MRENGPNGKGETIEIRLANAHGNHVVREVGPRVLMFLVMRRRITDHSFLCSSGGFYSYSTGLYSNFKPRSTPMYNYLPVCRYSEIIVCCGSS